MKPNYPISPIGYIRSAYTQKFGLARQPGLVPAAKSVLTLLPQYGADCVRGLAEFDYVWIHFVFHEAVAEGWAPLVRPPRLGGKQKMGVFATRSPHRPNHLGLSLLKLERLETSPTVCLHLGGSDLLDGTPVIDIKPYLPFVEAKPEASSAYVAGPPPRLMVSWENAALEKLALLRQDADFRQLVEQSVSQDPRPAYQDLPERIYVMRLHHLDVHFRIVAQQAWIVDVNEHGQE